MEKKIKEIMFQLGFQYNKNLGAFYTETKSSVSNRLVVDNHIDIKILKSIIELYDYNLLRDKI